MILLPAVDILEGRAVRLEQGDFSRETVYSADPLETAREWVAGGAGRLHVVDLDGARAGEPVNLEHLRRIAEELDVAIQYGGGLRSLEALRAALAAGADRVILGTAAYTDDALLESAISELGPEPILVAVDVRDGRVSVSAWTEEMALGPGEVIARMQERGAERFIYTQIDRDGTLRGPDLDEIRAVSDAVPGGRFLYSGGIASLDDLRALASLGLRNLEGVVSGKALYERRFTIADARTALSEASACC